MCIQGASGGPVTARFGDEEKSIVDRVIGVFVGGDEESGHVNLFDENTNAILDAIVTKQADDQKESASLEQSIEKYSYIVKLSSSTWRPIDKFC